MSEPLSGTNLLKCVREREEEGVTAALNWTVPAAKGRMTVTALMGADASYPDLDPFLCSNWAQMLPF